MPGRGSNASAELFGWDFQIKSAIFLMLKNIKSSLSVRVEGELQDIEILKDDGTILYAQAKSVQNFGDYRNITANLRSALKSLDKAEKSKTNKCTQIMFITNTDNPFNADKAAFYGSVLFKYSELPSDCQLAISHALALESITAFDVNKFCVQVIPFYNDDLDTRYRIITDVIKEFLADIQIPDQIISAKDLLSTWTAECFENGSLKNKDLTIKKEQFIWPLIVVLMDASRCQWLEDEMDEAIMTDVERKYKSIITKASERMALCIKVMGKYNDFIFSGPQSQKAKTFVESEWVFFKPDINWINANDEEREFVIKLILTKIINRRKCIEEVKKGANL